jgi:hypothetical protein
LHPMNIIIPPMAAQIAPGIIFRRWSLNGILILPELLPKFI